MPYFIPDLGEIQLTIVENGSDFDQLDRMHHHWLKTESIVLPSTFMRSDRLEKLNIWFAEQLAALKAEGASEKELKDGALADLALRKVFEEHFDRIRQSNPPSGRGVFLMHCLFPLRWSR